VNVTGQGVEHLQETMKTEELPWRSFADEGPITRGRIATRWNLTATPTLYVIDAQGVIRYKWVGKPGDEVIDAALEKLIEKAESGRDVSRE
jgi:peroxiredoxin